MLGRNGRGRQLGRATEHLLYLVRDLVRGFVGDGVPLIVLVMVLDHAVAVEELQVLAQELQGSIRNRALVDVFAGRIAVAVQHGLGLHVALDVLDQAPQHPLVIQLELFGLGRATEE